MIFSSLLFALKLFAHIRCHLKLYRIMLLSVIWDDFIWVTVKLGSYYCVRDRSHTFCMACSHTNSLGCVGTPVVLRRARFNTANRILRYFVCSQYSLTSNGLTVSQKCRDKTVFVLDELVSLARIRTFGFNIASVTLLYSLGYLYAIYKFSHCSASEYSSKHIRLWVNTPFIYWTHLSKFTTSTPSSIFNHVL